MIFIEKLKENITFAYCDNRYIRQRLVIELNCDLERDTMTAVSLLAFVLSSATDKHRDMISLSRYLDQLYGASLYVSGHRVGTRMMLHFDTDCVSSRYLPDESVGLNAVKLLCEVLAEPYLPDGVFPDSTIEIESEKLKEEIRFLINDKESYCTRMLMNELFKGSKRSLPSLGFEEDIPKISSLSLMEVYKKCLENCNVNIFYCGDQCDLVKQILSSMIEEYGIGRSPVTYVNEPVVLPADPFYIKEDARTEQDIISMAFHSARIPDEKDLTVLKIANAIFGGMPTSRLFLNVREKQGLCYSCVSNRMTGGGSGILVEASTSKEKYEKSREGILTEFVRLRDEGPSVDELENAKHSLINSTRSLFDTVSGASSHYLAAVNSLRKYITPEEEIRLIQNVSGKDVQSCLDTMQLCGLYRLTDE